MPTKKNNILINLKIASQNNKSCKVFTDEISDDFQKISSGSPADYVKYCWDKYEKIKSQYCKNDQSERALNGAIFDLIIRTCLYREGILPMYLQACVTFVPNVKYDVILFDGERNAPIGISIKKSLRERYKQADLEAVALKYVHRRAKNYLVGLDRDENDNAGEKIIEGSIMGLDKIITADSKDFNDFIASLKKLKLIEPPNVPVIYGTVIKK